MSNLNGHEKKNRASWVKLYRAAVVEINPMQRTERIRDALDAIAQRELYLQTIRASKIREVILLNQAKRILNVMSEQDS